MLTKGPDSQPHQQEPDAAAAAATPWEQEVRAEPFWGGGGGTQAMDDCGDAHAAPSLLCALCNGSLQQSTSMVVCEPCQCQLHIECAIGIDKFDAVKVSGFIWTGRNLVGGPSPGLHQSALSSCCYYCDLLTFCSVSHSTQSNGRTFNCSVCRQPVDRMVVVQTRAQ